MLARLLLDLTLSLHILFMLGVYLSTWLSTQLLLFLFYMLRVRDISRNLKDPFKLLDALRSATMQCAWHVAINGGCGQIVLTVGGA